MHREKGRTKMKKRFAFSTILISTALILGTTSAWAANTSTGTSKAEITFTTNAAPIIVDPDSPNPNTPIDLRITEEIRQPETQDHSHSIMRLTSILARTKYLLIKHSSKQKIKSLFTSNGSTYSPYEMGC